MMTVGIIEGVAEATAAIVKVFSGALSDWLGRRKILAVIGYGLAAITKPVFPMAASMGRFMRFLPNAPITPDQVRQLQNDNVVSEAAKSEGRTLDAFGIRPRSIDAILPSYLIRFRPQGQFTQPQPQAGGLDAQDQEGVV